jgi:hypothetical protein
VPVDGLLVEALGDSPPGSAAELVSALGEIAARLRVARGGKATPSARLNGASTVAAVPPGHRLSLLRTGPTPGIVTMHGGAGSQPRLTSKHLSSVPQWMR